MQDLLSSFILELCCGHATMNHIERDR